MRLLKTGQVRSLQVHHIHKYVYNEYNYWVVIIFYKKNLRYDEVVYIHLCICLSFVPCPMVSCLLSTDILYP